MDACPHIRHGVRNRTDVTFQSAMLQGVSRTFALTIPCLPDGLRTVVANAYLLCRIVDTIEDEPAMNAARKREFCNRFVDVVAAKSNAECFAEDLTPLLSQDTSPAERDLVKQSGTVLAITYQFNESQRAAISQCIQVMANGMAAYQEKYVPRGVPDLAHVDRYCYYVAGVVGEMLTRLFCNYSKDVGKNGEELMRLSVSFGQGLQMTNILKDVWEDYRRGTCWLPRDVFLAHGIDLDKLDSPYDKTAFAAAMEQLIAIAHGHLRNALEFSLLIPRKETGIRLFCLWAIAMALLTLRKLRRRPGFSSASEVKISRRSVKTSIGILRPLVKSNTLLKILFHLTGFSLPWEPARNLNGAHAHN